MILDEGGITKDLANREAYHEHVVATTRGELEQAGQYSTSGDNTMRD